MSSGSKVTAAGTLDANMIKPIRHQLPKTSSGLTHEPLIHVLHVDDDENFLTCSKRNLEKEGRFQIETASSVKEAWEKTGQKPFDVILSDYQMPERSGLDFLKELRNYGNDIPFILFTGYCKEEIAIEALKLGADRYFSKNGSYESVYVKVAQGIRESVKARHAKQC
jgi:DNA-binding NtrC family response regulator